MRLVLVLAAVIGLVAALWFALATDPASPALDPASVAPEPRAERKADPLPPEELAQPERSPGTANSAAAGARIDGAASSAKARIAIAIVDEQGRKPGRGIEVECRDGLARTLALEPDSDLVFRAQDVAPGELTISVVGPRTIPAVERIVVLPAGAEQRFEIRIATAPVVRVRWQTDDGRPILEALGASQLLPGIPFLCVAADSAVRSVGDFAPACRRSAYFSTGTGNGPPRSTWPGAPPDALCEIVLATAPPAVLRASIDGTVVGTAAVDDVTREVVFRTPLELLRQMHANVRFCLVDAATGAPVPDAQFSGRPREGTQWWTEVGPTGCADHRFTPGRSLVEFRAPGRASLFRVVDLQPGAEADLGELRFEPPGQVVVRVRHVDGGAAGAVRLALFPAERLEWDQRTVVSTDAGGVARFADLPSGPHVLVVSDPRYACRPLIVEPSPPGGRDVVELRVEPGVEIALDFGPQATNASRAFLHDQSGTPIAILSLPVSGFLPLRLLPGGYVVELEGANSARAITVTDESVVFDLR